MSPTCMIWIDNAEIFANDTETGRLGGGVAACRLRLLQGEPYEPRRTGQTRLYLHTGAIPRTARRSGHSVPLCPIPRPAQPQTPVAAQKRTGLPALLPHCRRQRPLARQPDAAKTPGRQRRHRGGEFLKRRHRLQPAAGRRPARHRRPVVEPLHPGGLRPQP